MFVKIIEVSVTAQPLIKTSTFVIGGAFLRRGLSREEPDLDPGP